MTTKQIDEFIQIFHKFKDLQTQQKMRGLNDFNIFTTLRGGTSDEVRLHSRFLAFLLDPNAEHNQDDLFLDLFLKEIGLTNFFSDLNNCYTHAEYNNIDIYISDGEKHIIVENKIWAGDQQAQIKRYIEIINKENKNLANDDMIVIYLSVDRNSPSKYSLCLNEENCPNGFYIENKKIIGKGENKNREYNFLNLHYDKQITNWLDKAHTQIANITNLAFVIQEYQEVIQKLYGKYKEKVMDLNEYLKDKENKTELVKTMAEISDEFIKVKIQLQMEFWQDLLNKLNNNDDYYNEEQFYFSNEYTSNKRKIKKACETYYQGSRNNTQQGIIYNLNDKRIMLITNHNTYFAIKKNKTKGNLNNIDSKTIDNNAEGYFYTTNFGRNLNFRSFNEKLIENICEKRNETIDLLANEFKNLVEKLKKLEQ